MKNLILRHKLKIILVTPFLIVFLITLGAILILSSDIGKKNTQINKPQKDLLAERYFSNIDIKAKSFIVFDSKENRIVYSLNKEAQLPLASLTKIMSALTALELASEDMPIEVVFSDSGQDLYDRKIVSPGVWKLGDLLKLTLISSSNNGISSVSGYLQKAGKISPDKKFVDLMNDKAKELNLPQTFFLNESGLDINESLSGAYGSALDMANLLNYAMKKNPEVFESTKYDSIVINSLDGKTEVATNSNPSVSSIEGLVVSKTGYTDLAGGNLLIAFDIDNTRRVIIVVLGSTQEDRFTDTLKLALSTYSYYQNK